MNQRTEFLKSSDLLRVTPLVYPIMLTQEVGEITESKAAELIGLDIVSYREVKAKAVGAIMAMLEQLPSPLILLLEGTKAQPKSSTKTSG